MLLKSKYIELHTTFDFSKNEYLYESYVSQLGISKFLEIPKIKLLEAEQATSFVNEVIEQFPSLFSMNTGMEISVLVHSDKKLAYEYSKFLIIRSLLRLLDCRDTENINYNYVTEKLSLSKNVASILTTEQFEILPFYNYQSTEKLSINSQITINHDSESLNERYNSIGGVELMVRRHDKKGIIIKFDKSLTIHQLQYQEAIYAALYYAFDRYIEKHQGKDNLLIHVNNINGSVGVTHEATFLATMIGLLKVLDCPLSHLPQISLKTRKLEITDKSVIPIYKPSFYKEMTLLNEKAKKSKVFNPLLGLSVASVLELNPNVFSGKTMKLVKLAQKNSKRIL